MERSVLECFFFSRWMVLCKVCQVKMTCKQFNSVSGKLNIFKNRQLKCSVLSLPSIDNKEVCKSTDRDGVHWTLTQNPLQQPSHLTQSIFCLYHILWQMFIKTTL